MVHFELYRLVVLLLGLGCRIVCVCVCVYVCVRAYTPMQHHGFDPHCNCAAWGILPLEST